MSESKQEQHMQTPWILGGSAAWSEAAKDRGPIFICDIREGTHVPVGTNQANARFIVEAVNNHHRYKAALEAISAVTDGTSISCCIWPKPRLKSSPSWNL